MPALHKIIGETFVPKADDEKRFMDKHVVTLFKNIYSKEEYDKLFKGSSIKTVEREGERHGYSTGNDEKVYETFEEAEEALLESEDLAETYSLHDLMNGAHHYNLRNGTEHKMGHIAHAVMKTAKQHGEPMYSVKSLTGVNEYGELESVDGDHGKSIVGGTGKFAGKTQKFKKKTIETAFNKHLADAEKKDIAFDPSKHSELCESEMIERLAKVDELMEEQMLEESSHHFSDHVAGMKQAAKYAGTTHAVIGLAMAGAAHALGGSSAVHGAAQVAGLGIAASSPEYWKGIHDAYHAGHSRNRELRHKGIGLKADKLVSKSKSARKSVQSSEKPIQVRPVREDKFTPEYQARLAEVMQDLQEISKKKIEKYRKAAFEDDPGYDDGSQKRKKRQAGRKMAFNKVTHGAKVMATGKE